MSSFRPFNKKIEDEFDAYVYSSHNTPVPVEIYIEALGESLEWNEALDGYSIPTTDKDML